MSARLLRRARLLKPAEFKAAFAQGRRLHESGLTLVVVANELGHPRLGMAVPKKAVALAVERNRIKRQIRESFRIRQTELPAADFVVLVKPGKRALSTPLLRPSLERMWTRASAPSARLSSPSREAAPSS
ncbi:ribonuclease P protein component [Solimonas aquatica]|uniref:ribonuclease P protein component n=1 Tax=Solimonas aquatica TaxID=489703 RepID=UPI000AE482D7